MAEVHIKTHPAHLGVGAKDDLLDAALRIIATAFGDEGEWPEKYGANIENDVFTMRRFYWGDCDCGTEEEEPHRPTCSLELPNFHYKPTDFRLSWYKYIGRDMEANQDSLPGDFLHRIFAAHPKGMTIEQAIDQLARRTEEIATAFSAILSAPMADLSKATPRPWSLEASGTTAANGSFHLYVIQEDTGRKIAAIWGREEEKSDTGALIVKAVNERDELIAALQAQMEVSLQFMRRYGFSEQEVADSTAQARAVLAKAEDGTDG